MFSSMQKQIRPIGMGYLLIAILASVVVWLFFIGGGFDKFRAPIEIHVPVNFKGLMCARVIEGSEQTQKQQLIYEVDAHGYFDIDGDLLRSHRERKLFQHQTESSELSAIPPDQWFGIHTENSPTGNDSYFVYWIGSNLEWQKFQSQHTQSSFCLRR